MTRKRIIKPEFWTDSTVVQLPIEARLLFIGMWNFADDFGYLDDEPDRLALQILPADDIDVDLMIDLLVAAGRVERYAKPDGGRFLYIPHFTEHQRVDHPAKPTYPDITKCHKVSIPLNIRREVAIKYGCDPGDTTAVTCYYCGAVGSIHWPLTRKGAPSSWVAFSNMEMDHFVAESIGGETTSDNLILACRHCNRTKHTAEALTFAINREDSRGITRTPKSSPQVKLSQDKLIKPNGGDRGRARTDTTRAPSQNAAAARLLGIGFNQPQTVATIKQIPDLSVDDVAAWEAWLPTADKDNPIAFMAWALERGQRRPDPPLKNTKARLNGHTNGLSPPRTPQPDLHEEQDELGNVYLALADGTPWESAL